MFHKAEFLSVQEAQYNNNEYLRVPNLHRPEALAHSLQEVHIVKIQCIQHEHTHTQTHTRMHAHAYTHTHAQTPVSMYVSSTCLCPSHVIIIIIIIIYFFGGGGLKKKKGALIQLKFFVTRVSVSVQNKSIAHSQICTTTTKVSE